VNIYFNSLPILNVSTSFSPALLVNDPLKRYRTRRPSDEDIASVWASCLRLQKIKPLRVITGANHNKVSFSNKIRYSLFFNKYLDLSLQKSILHFFHNPLLQNNEMGKAHLLLLSFLKARIS